jgi:anti-anti-sigma regulatory factor
VAGDPVLITCDLSALGPPDAEMLDALLRLHLAAQRMGGSLRLRNVCPQLRDLLALAGLDDLIVVQ